MNTATWIIVIVILLLIGYDTIAAIKYGYKDTISWDILNTSLSHPILPFAAGVLCGHFFWPQRHKP